MNTINLSQWTKLGRLTEGFLSAWCMLQWCAFMLPWVFPPSHERHFDIPAPRLFLNSKRRFGLTPQQASRTSLEISVCPERHRSIPFHSLLHQFGLQPLHWWISLSQMPWGVYRVRVMPLGLPPPCGSPGGRITSWWPRDSSVVSIIRLYSILQESSLPLVADLVANRALSVRWNSVSWEYLWLSPQATVKPG
jgi:hypothetical protein